MTKETYKEKVAGLGTDVEPLMDKTTEYDDATENVIEEIVSIAIKNNDNWSSDFSAKKTYQY